MPACPGGRSARDRRRRASVRGRSGTTDDVAGDTGSANGAGDARDERAWRSDVRVRATLVGLVVVVGLGAIVRALWGWWPGLLAMMAAMLIVAPLRARRVVRRPHDASPGDRAR